MLESTTIYDKIYELLCKKNIEKLTKPQFYAIIRDFRLRKPKNGFIDHLEEELLANGMLPEQVKKIVNLILYVRFTNDDAYEIEQEMRRRGMIKRNSTWRIFVIPPKKLT